ncbi:MAG: YggT family protein [Anaerolineae bacterium]|nr:YggT family protein [Anaerolineae bacterium]
MVDEVKDRVYTVEGDGYERKQRVVEYQPSTRAVVVSRLNALIWLVADVIAGLIAIRFVLKLLAANPNNGFGQLIFQITDALVAPFAGLLGSIGVTSGSTVELVSIVAIVVYLLLALVITSLIRILFASAGGARRVTTVEHVD